MISSLISNISVNAAAKSVDDRGQVSQFRMFRFPGFLIESKNMLAEAYLLKVVCIYHISYMISRSVSVLFGILFTKCGRHFALATAPSSKERIQGFSFPSSLRLSRV